MPSVLLLISSSACTTPTRGDQVIMLPPPCSVLNIGSSSPSQTCSTLLSGVAGGEAGGEGGATGGAAGDMRTGNHEPRTPLYSIPLSLRSLLNVARTIRSPDMLSTFWIAHTPALQMPLWYDARQEESELQACATMWYRSRPSVLLN